MINHTSNRYSLVADIGGTNTRVALADGTKLLPETVTKFSNRNFDNLQDVVAGYIRDQGNVDCAGACVAVAGPVHDGVGALTNLDWAIDLATLQAATKAENVCILNDLQAQSHAVDHLPLASISALVSGPAKPPHSAKLVIGVGTGFNTAAIFDTDLQRLVPPSEAGHADMPIRCAQDLALQEFISNGGAFPAVEDVLSGRGLERVYAWHGQTSAQTGRISAADIMTRLAAGQDAQARAAAATFVRILGTVIGNLALVHLPFGGIYLAGGVARAIAPHLGAFDFETALKDKGRFAAFMDNFSVSLITDDNAALIGCAQHLSLSIEQSPNR